jgi:hypothetical protein
VSAPPSFGTTIMTRLNPNHSPKCWSDVYDVLLKVVWVCFAFGSQKDNKKRKGGGVEAKSAPKKSKVQVGGLTDALDNTFVSALG